LQLRQGTTLAPPPNIGLFLRVFFFNKVIYITKGFIYFADSFPFPEGTMNQSTYLVMTLKALCVGMMMALTLALMLG